MTALGPPSRIDQPSILPIINSGTSQENAYASNAFSNPRISQASGTPTPALVNQGNMPKVKTNWYLLIIVCLLIVVCALASYIGWGLAKPLFDVVNPTHFVFRLWQSDADTYLNNQRKPKHQSQPVRQNRVVLPNLPERWSLLQQLP